MSSGMNGTKSRGVFTSVGEMQSADLRTGVTVWVHGGSRYDIHTTDQGGSVQLNNGLWAKEVSGSSGGGGSGESNTASNLGTGAGVFAQKVGVELQFKSFKAIGGASISTDTSSITVDTSNLQSAINAKQETLVSGANIKTVGGQSLLGSGDIPLSGGGGGEANTASNVGGGQGLFANKSGVDLRFKSLKVTGGATIGSDSDSITISVSEPTPVETATTIKQKYESNTNTNAFTDANLTKLDSIASGAQVNVVNGIVAGPNVTVQDNGSGIFSISASTASSTGDMSKSTYDPTNIAKDAFNMDNMVEGASKKILTVAERNAIAANSTKRSYPSSDETKLQGIQAGAQVNPTSYDWTKVTNRPTTLAGYGITNAASLTTGGTQTFASNIVSQGLFKAFDAYTVSSNIGYLRYSSSVNSIQFDSSGVSFSSAPKPLNDGGVSCGTSGRRFSTVYAQTSSINTSDARLKTELRCLSDAEHAVSKELRKSIGFYKWLRRVEEKGAEARLHCGVTVQKVIEVFQKHGLDPFEYGIVCYDATEDIINERGEEETIFIDLYSLRTEELLFFLLATIDV